MKSARELALHILMKIESDDVFVNIILNDELNKYFDKTARKYNIDIDKYYLSILKYFPYQKNFDDFNYKEKLKHANFNCNTHVNIISSLLITKT